MSVLVAEARKVPAFMRRDWLVMLSYRVGVRRATCSPSRIQAVDVRLRRRARSTRPSCPPTAAWQASYFEFVMIGVVITTVSGLLLQRVATAIRQEQMIGTLEALLVTPTSPTTVQVGSVAFDLLFIPIRMALLLLAVALTLGLGYRGRAASCRASSLLAALRAVRLGPRPRSPPPRSSPSAAAPALLGVVMSVLGLASGAFFPLALLPAWLQTLAEANPVAIAMEGTREALIGGAGWSAVGSDAARARRRSRRPRCSRASSPSAPRWRASTGAGRWGCTDMWERVDELLAASASSHRRAARCTASSCSRRAAGAPPGIELGADLIADETRVAVNELAAPALLARVRAAWDGPLRAHEGPRGGARLRRPRPAQLRRPRPPDRRRRGARRRR